MERSVKMKITRRQIRKLVAESLDRGRIRQMIMTEQSNLPDDTYDYMIDDYFEDNVGAPGQIGLDIVMTYYDEKHPLYRGQTDGLLGGEIEFEDYDIRFDAATGRRLTDDEVYDKVIEIATKIIEHPASRLEGTLDEDSPEFKEIPNEKYDASQELIDAMRGNTSNTGFYFMPMFPPEDDRDELTGRRFRRPSGY